VHLVGFSVGIILQCVALWTSNLKYLFVFALILKFLKRERSVSNVVESIRWNPMWEGKSCFNNQVISCVLSTQMFITFYSCPTWTLFWAKQIHFTALRLILMFTSHLCLDQNIYYLSFIFFQLKICKHFSCLPYALYVLPSKFFEFITYYYLVNNTIPHYTVSLSLRLPPHRIWCSPQHFVLKLS